MTAEEYFSAEGLSNSMLSKLDQSPAHLRDYLDNPSETTRAMEIGTFVHELILLANCPMNIVIKPDKMSFATKEGKSWRSEQEAAGLKILTREEHDSIYGTFNSIMANPRLRLAVEQGDPEQAFFAPWESINRKARIDLLPRNAAAILDFKTCQDASPAAFSKTIANLGYYRQAAYYLDIAQANGLPHTAFVFVAVEKHPPYAVGIYELDPDAIDFGRREWQRLADLYIRCKEANDWPGYSPEPVRIGLPHWAMKEAA